MDDMKLIVKILGLIREQEKEGVYNAIVFSEECLKSPQRQIDTLALKLKKAGYIDGLLTIEDIDNCEKMILWQQSKPEITLSGIEYMNENSVFRKAKDRLKERGNNFTHSFRQNFNRSLLIAIVHSSQFKTTNRTELSECLMSARNNIIPKSE